MKGNLPTQAMQRLFHLALSYISESQFEEKLPKLTSRQRQVVALLGQGMNNKEIAYVLGTTEGTVKVYVSRLSHKLHKRRTEMAILGSRIKYEPTIERQTSPSRA